MNLKKIAAGGMVAAALGFSALGLGAGVADAKPHPNPPGPGHGDWEDWGDGAWYGVFGSVDFVVDKSPRSAVLPS